MNNRMAYLINKERERIVNKFITMDYYKPRVVRSIARSIILNGPYTMNGGMWDIKSKHLGAGVYELRKELHED